MRPDSPGAATSHIGGEGITPRNCRHAFRELFAARTLPLRAKPNGVLTGAQNIFRTGPYRCADVLEKAVAVFVGYLPAETKHDAFFAVGKGHVIEPSFSHHWSARS